jgi:ATP-dependent Lon protease
VLELELGPKGTGKQHIYSEFSPHGILISGSEVTTAKLFVNNASGRVGLVGYWDCICFDEFAGKDKKVDKNLVDIMKNYMANKSFSRGIESLGAEASMVFMGNTRHSVAYMLKQGHLFEELPDKYIDSAFVDRIHAYNPGWEVSPIQNELFSNGYGLIVDYLAEILRHLRSEDFSQKYRKHFELSDDLTTRDQDAIQKTFSGLMKLIYPSGLCSVEEEREVLHFAVECRKRVKDHILRLDDTFEVKNFSYLQLESGVRTVVKTTEEEQYPDLAPARPSHHRSSDTVEAVRTEVSAASSPSSVQNRAREPLRSGEHVVVRENLKGYDYDNRPTFHARSIQTDTGWKISLDRGLDIFQRYDTNSLSLAAADQTERLTKAFEITYLLEPEKK